MRIKHRYSFNESNIKVKQFLDSNNINYTPSFGLITIEIYEDDNFCTDIKKIMEDENIIPITEKIFSKNEIEKAKWLRIRSKWRWEYPQPDNDFGYKSNTYDNSKLCIECGSGLVQKNVFFLKKEPKWGNKQFLQLNWIEDELFINTSIIADLENNEIQGLSFLPVKNVRTKEELKNIRQLKITNILKKGFVIDDKDIKKKIVCSSCQIEKIVLQGSSVLKLKTDKISNSLDIVKSFEIFGDGKMATRYILISHKFAKLIMNKKWKNIVLEPIQLI
jgi:hypothetical protein